MFMVIIFTDYLGQEEARDKEKALIPGEHELVRKGFKSKMMVFMNIMGLGLMIPAFWNILPLRWILMQA